MAKHTILSKDRSLLAGYVMALVYQGDACPKGPIPQEPDDKGNYVAVFFDAGKGVDPDAPDTVVSLTEKGLSTQVDAPAPLWSAETLRLIIQTTDNFVALAEELSGTTEAPTIAAEAKSIATRMIALRTSMIARAFV